MFLRDKINFRITMFILVVVNTIASIAIIIIITIMFMQKNVDYKNLQLEYSTLQIRYENLHKDHDILYRDYINEREINSILIADKLYHNDEKRQNQIIEWGMNGVKRDSCNLE